MIVHSASEIAAAMLARDETVDPIAWGDALVRFYEDFSLEEVLGYLDGEAMAMLARPPVRVSEALRGLPLDFRAVVVFAAIEGGTTTVSELRARFWIAVPTDRRIEEAVAALARRGLVVSEGGRLMSRRASR
jgi:hypothetical protein